MIEGPAWAGMWSELSRDALTALGHEVELHHHNVKPLLLRLYNGLARVWPRRSLAGRVAAAQVAHSNRALLARMSQRRWDVLLSIQGKIDATTLALLRRQHPGLRVLYWWGDILTEAGAATLQRLAGEVDALLMAYPGDIAHFCQQHPGLATPHLLPFGVSSTQHACPALTASDRQRYAARISFVGTHYPERAALLANLGQRLGQPVVVWGRGWRRQRDHIDWRGPLTLAESLKVHALSDISLNLHHQATRNGLNMKTYEIPAVGGFELCDWQPCLDDLPIGRGIPTYRHADELAGLVHFYLGHAEQRSAMAQTAHAAVWQHHRYEDQFAALLSEVCGPASQNIAKT